MKKNRVYTTDRSIEEIIEDLRPWIVGVLELPEVEQSQRGDTTVLRSVRTGVIRQLVGFVLELTIELTPTGNGFCAVVDNGDLRKQLVSLGVSLFLFWPILITMGLGAWTNHQILDQVLGKLDELAAESPAERITV